MCKYFRCLICVFTFFVRFLSCSRTLPYPMHNLIQGHTFLIPLSHVNNSAFLVLSLICMYCFKVESFYSLRSPFLYNVPQAKYFYSHHEDLVLCSLSPLYLKLWLTLLTLKYYKFYKTYKIQIL